MSAFGLQVYLDLSSVAVRVLGTSSGVRWRGQAAFWSGNNTPTAGPGARAPAGQQFPGGYTSLFSEKFAGLPTDGFGGSSFTKPIPTNKEPKSCFRTPRNAQNCGAHGWQAAAHHRRCAQTAAAPPLQRQAVQIRLLHPGGFCGSQPAKLPGSLPAAPQSHQDPCSQSWNQTHVAGAIPHIPQGVIP